jgi:hypothetical protein
LIQAYQRKQWSINEILRNSTQCIHDRARHFANLGEDEGCMVSGRMLVNKVAGNFHIAQGESIVRDGRHIHQFNPALAPKFNVSHTVHSLSFGEPYPSMPVNPLDGGESCVVLCGFTWSTCLHGLVDTDDHINRMFEVTNPSSHHPIIWPAHPTFCSQAHHRRGRDDGSVPVLHPGHPHHLHERVRLPDLHQPVHHHRPLPPAGPAHARRA